MAKERFSIDFSTELIDSILSDLSEVDEDIELTDLERAELVGRFIGEVKGEAVQRMKKLVMQKVVTRLGKEKGPDWEAVVKYFLM